MIRAPSVVPHGIIIALAHHPFICSAARFSSPWFVIRRRFSVAALVVRPAPMLLLRSRGTSRGVLSLLQQQQQRRQQVQQAASKVGYVTTQAARLAQGTIATSPRAGTKAPGATRRTKHPDQPAGSSSSSSPAAAATATATTSNKRAGVDESDCEATTEDLKVTTGGGELTGAGAVASGDTAVADAAIVVDDDHVSQDLGESVRLAMRQLPHQLVVITAGRLPSEERQGHDETPSAPASTTAAAHGLLASSFNTVTLHPVPMVSFNIRRPSRTYDAIMAAGPGEGGGTFEVSAVWDASLLREYSRGYGGGAGAGGAGGAGGKKTASRLRQTRLWGLGCEVVRDKCVSVGDHEIVVGRVLEVCRPVVVAKDNAESKKPLCYVDGVFAEVDTSEKGG